MKVVQINAVYGVGSTGVITKAIHNILQKNGHTSYVFYGTACVNETEDSHLIRIGTAFDHKLHALLSRIAGTQGFFSKRATKKLIRRLREIEPDIVQLHNLHNNFIHIDMLLSYLKDAPLQVVITQHDCFLFTGKCFHYAATGCMKWKTGCGSCPRRFLDYPAYLWDASCRIWKNRNKLYQHMDNLTVVNVSDWLTAETKQSMLGKKPMQTLYNGVDTERFRPIPDMRKKYGIPENRFVILTMANKWFDPKNRTVTDAVMRSLDDRTVLVIVGCTDAQKSIQTDRIKPLSYIKNPSELAELYSAADVFYNLTWEDSLPTVNLEAQACGTPVITNAVTGATETVHETTGIRISPGEPNQAVQALATVRERGKDAYREPCRAWILAHFEQKQCYQEYVKLYERIEQTTTK